MIVVAHETTFPANLRIHTRSLNETTMRLGTCFKEVLSYELLHYKVLTYTLLSVLTYKLLRYVLPSMKEVSVFSNTTSTLILKSMNLH